MSDGNDRIRIAFFDDAGVATADMLGSRRQIWANAGVFGYNVRQLTGTEWHSTPLADLPNMSEIPENPDA